MVGLFENLIEMVFPTHCRICSEESGELICKKCMASFAPVDPPLCKFCGNISEEDDRDVCERCMHELPPYKLCRSVFIYKGALRECIRLIKFKNLIKLAPSIIDPVSLYFQRNEFIYPVDFIIPVPSNPKLRKTRKFNPASLFAEFLSKSSGIPVVEALRFSGTPEPQYKLDYYSRWENIKGAFEVKNECKGKIKNKSLLLLDDIVTSGATITECSKALLDGGAKEVYVLTVSRTVKKD